MQVSVTFRHMEATQALKDFAIDKVERALKKYLKTPFEAHVVLSTERHNHHCDVTVLVAGHTIRASEKSDDMYASIDKVGDKIERQVSRYKDKLRHHKTSSHDADVRNVEALISLLDQQDEAPATDVTPLPEPKILNTETVVVRPLDLDDAVMAMDLSQEQFLVFTNIQSGNISVLYRREDGKYGLIDTKASAKTAS